VSQQTDRLSAALAGRYRIERHLGEGGMASVYLAEDLKHDRKVALKLLKPELAAVLGAERFVQEIKTTASLQHPHILPLFDSGTADGFLFYVMPFIKGETLRDRLNRETQLGVDEAVRIAREVADALDYAHRNGVIHRDIKPENILLHDGRPMVADFGIALAVSAAAGGRMTETGLSLGTPHYMSPEQATADKEITGRSDIYSLASVLYEMLAGQPPHLGGSAQQIIMKIIAEPVDTVTRYRKAVPPNVAAALGRALEKLPADRFDSARTFGEALASPGFTHGAVAVAAGGVLARQRQWLSWLGWGAAAILAGVAALGWIRRTPPLPLSRLDVTTGSIEALPRDIVISPDGSMLALAGRRGAENAIWVRRLDGDAEFRKVPGTEGGIFPSFSPDNQWIVFRRHPARTLVKVLVTGGNAATLLEQGSIDPYSPHWGTDDHIVFSSPQGNYRIAATGGKPELLAKIAGRTPFLLPDGSGVLFSRGRSLGLYEFDSDSAFDLGASGVHPVLVASGFIVHSNENGALVASRFDRRRRHVSGTPVSIADRVGAQQNSRGFSISYNGSLVMIDAEPDGALLGESVTRLLVVTIGGSTDTLRLPTARRVQPRFSPNGRMLAFRLEDIDGVGRADIHTVDLVTETNVQLTFEGDNGEPTWSPDGTSILFSRTTDSTSEDLWMKPADNSAQERRILSLPGNQWPATWPTNDLIVFNTTGTSGIDLQLWSPSKTGAPTTYLAAPWNEFGLRVSPDGKFAAYVSNEGGAPEVWIRDFPIPQGKWRVSRGQSNAPRWSRDGRFLYYTHAGGGGGIDTLYRVRVDRTPSLTIAASKEVLFIGDIDGIANWDLHPDDKRFVVAVPVGAQRGALVTDTTQTPRFIIALNWVPALERLMAQHQRP